MTLWRRLLKRDALDRELDAELRDHLERQVADHLRAGMSEAEARRRAAAQFGGLEQAKEYCRDVRGMRWAADFAMDVRYGLRMLAHSRTFTLVAVLSLALGIGANTAIFTLVNGLLLRSLPVHEPERLVRVDGEWTNPIWEQIQSRQADLFAGATAWSATRFDLSRGGREQPVEGLWASGEFFDVYGVPAILGRTFTPANDRRGGGLDATVAVISYRFWQRHFGGAADAVGRTLTLNRVPFTVIGVTAPGFDGPVIGRTVDVVVPLRTVDVLESDGAEGRLEGRSMWWLDIIARLKDGQSIEQATAALRAAQPQIREATTPVNWPAEHLASYLREGLVVAPASQGPSFLRTRFEQPLLTIMIVVALVLLIACANIANLMLARASGRRHELAMRLALGASRGRIARQLLTESLLLSSLGALLGLGFAQWGSALLVSQFSTASDPLMLDLSLDWRVLGFTAVVAVLTALLFGVAPAMTARRLAPMDALKEQGRGHGGRHRLAGPLVVAQIALSVVLVVGAGLFVRTFLSLQTRDVGFDRDAILLVNLDTQRSRVDDDSRADLYARLAEAASRVPGVERAAASLLTPVSGMGWNNAFEVPDRPQLSFRERLSFINAVTPGWHSVYGMRLVAGREFTGADRDGAPPVVIVNEAFAGKFLKPGDALGQLVQPDARPDGARPPAMTVVGVVRNAAYRNLREEIPPTIFIPLAQSDIVFPSGAVSVRAALPPSALVRPLTEALTAIDPDVSIAFRPFREQVGARIVRERVLAMLGGFFGALALLLAAVGLYGVTSYAVNLRRAEIGVRMALGADVSRVLRLVLGRAWRLVAMGVILGTGLSLWLATFVRTLLFGLEPRDVTTLAIAIAVMAVVGTAAAFLPAWKAAGIQPVDVLREG